MPFSWFMNQSVCLLYMPLLYIQSFYKYFSNAFKINKTPTLPLSTNKIRNASKQEIQSAASCGYEWVLLFKSIGKWLWKGVIFIHQVHVTTLDQIGENVQPVDVEILECTYSLYLGSIYKYFLYHTCSLLKVWLSQGSYFYSTTNKTNMFYTIYWNRSILLVKLKSSTFLA